MSRLSPPDIKDLVRGDVEFQYARRGFLIYKCMPKAFTFRVPMDEMGDATFLDIDRAMMYMKWIKREIDERNKSVEGP